MIPYGRRETEAVGSSASYGVCHWIGCTAPGVCRAGPAVTGRVACAEHKQVLGDAREEEHWAPATGLEADADERLAEAAVRAWRRCVHGNPPPCTECQRTAFERTPLQARQDMAGLLQRMRETIGEIERLLERSK